MPDTQPTIPQLVGARYAKLRESDGAIRIAERALERHLAQERKARSLCILVRQTIRSREEQLRKEAATQIGKEIGAHVPGYGVRPLQGVAKRSLEAKLARQQAEVSATLSEPP